MIGCFPIVKYIYILVLFVFAFISWYMPSLEIVGFSSVFVIQTLFTSVVFLDIMNDSSRNEKNLEFTMLVNLIKRTEKKYSIPLYWVLLLGSILPFISSVIMMITTTLLFQKYKKIKMDRDSQWYSNIYKNIYIASTIMLFLIIYIYTQHSSSNFSPFIRLLLAFMIFSIVLWRFTMFL